MYKLLKLAFISLLILCFSACREEDPIMPPEQQTAEKTIFVFFHRVISVFRHLCVYHWVIPPLLPVCVYGQV